ncbi:MAG: MBL fold metallo-hydrolase [Synergistaceae bacterium]|nr:MBL fold metallo-hydrolase [Synergistaceae bacterium]
MKCCRRIKGNIFVLEVFFINDDGKEDAIFPVILAAESERGENVLVDCGYPGFLPKLEEASARAGFSLSALTAVLITHHDYDHYGALSELVAKYPRVRVIASELDAPYIENRKKSPRLAQAEVLCERLPKSLRAEAHAFQERLVAVKPVRVDETVRGGEVFPWCGGTEIIATPGHMPGHISLYVKEHGTVITGDALVTRNGLLRIANPNYATDAKEAKASARKLLKLNAKRFICYHGGVFAT